jgi:hypothetical protein
MTMASVRLALSAVAVALACGPSGSAGDEDGSGDDGPTTTDAPSCEMYARAPDIGPAVAVSVRHQGTTPLFFQPRGCGGSMVFEITSGGTPVPYLLDGECSPNTCDGFVGASDCSVGCNDCAPPTAGRIEPGGVGQSAWPGRRTTELELVDACAPAADCPDTCLRPDQAEPGTYEITFTAYRTCTGTCECDGPSSGVCGLWTGDEQLSDPATFSVTIDYPAQTMAEIVLGD